MGIALNILRNILLPDGKDKTCGCGTEVFKKACFHISVIRRKARGPPSWGKNYYQALYYRCNVSLQVSNVKKDFVYIELSSCPH